MESSFLNIQRTRAFTLVELLVTVAIITIVMSVILASQSSFNRSILLTDTAYTVALSVRQAQSLGISGKIFAANNNTGYGIHIDTSASPITSYIQFADILPVIGGAVNTLVCPGHTIVDPSNPESRPGNCLYDSAGEIVNKYTFSQGYTIGSFCGYIGASTSYCSNGGAIQLSKLDITFERPNVQTVMVGTSVGGVLEGDFDTACIQVKAPAASGIGSRYIEISKFGQILVTQSCP